MLNLNGIHLKHNKNTASLMPERIPSPLYICLPMSMHIGAPAKLIVKIGDRVKVGQLVGEAVGEVSSPIYSSVSGIVKKIEEKVSYNGTKVQNVIIENDGIMEISEEISIPVINSKEDFIEAVRKSGIVGLGGAGFPTFLKLKTDITKIDTLIINCAECEPYITSDTRTMLDDTENFIEGIRLISDYLEVEKIIIGIENNKSQCIRVIRKTLENDEKINIKSLPSIYPQGGEKVLVYHTAGRIIKEGQLPKDVGVVVINCTTAAELAKFIKTGIPLIERCVTVDGSAVKTPKNVIAPIGTPVSELFDFCGGFNEQPAKVLYGGPMMGIAIHDLSMPVLKQTNAVLAFDRKDAMPPEVTPCIKCGRCITYCPFGLAPVEISRAYELSDAENLEKLNVNLCMECGCCSYVCPAKRNLVQTNKLAKNMLKSYRMKKKEEGK